MLYITNEFNVTMLESCDNIVMTKGASLPDVIELVTSHEQRLFSMGEDKVKVFSQLVGVEISNSEVKNFKLTEDDMLLTLHTTLKEDKEPIITWLLVKVLKYNKELM